MALISWACHEDQMGRGKYKQLGEGSAGGRGFLGLFSYRAALSQEWRQAWLACAVPYSFQNHLQNG